MEIWLDIQSGEGKRRVPLAGSRMTVGRGESADLRISGTGLSRLHASIHCEGDRVWVLDEGSANGTSVNDVKVSVRGAPLSDGDVIQLGGDATIAVRFGSHGGKQPAAASQPASGTPRMALRGVSLVAAILLGVVLLGGIAVLAARQFKNRAGAQGDIRTGEVDSPPVSPMPTETRPSPSPSSTPVLSVGNLGSSLPMRYVDMTQEQRYEFLDREARRVTLLIGNREYVFEREVLDYIKEYVDQYARRVGNGSTRLWGEDLNRIFERATANAPLIIRAFRKERVPEEVGLYIAMIETEYNECLRSYVGALGLFQFMPGTAIGYGVSPDDRCKVEIMAPAAAKYMKDRIREFGNDGMSVALGIAGYNRSPQSVRRDLQDVISSRNNERSFWTLLAQKEKLDSYFRNENVKYVPKFFAATIVGENPGAFGLQIRKLSTYDQR